MIYNKNSRFSIRGLSFERLLVERNQERKKNWTLTSMAIDTTIK